MYNIETALIFPETSSVSDSFIAFSILHFTEKSCSWNIPLLLQELTVPNNRCTERMNYQSVNTSHMDRHTKIAPPHTQSTFGAVSTMAVPDNTETVSQLRRSSDQLMDSMTIWRVAGVADICDISLEKMKRKKRLQPSWKCATFSSRYT
jgi:hypothetical protein